MNIRSNLASTAAAVLIVSGSYALGAYPEKRIRVIAPFAAGASADIAARIITQKMGEILGQQFVVENRTGALGALGTAEFSKAPADGYTILYGNNGQITDVTGACDAIGKEPPYDPTTFVPIGRTQEAFFTLVANLDTDLKTMDDVIEFAKKNPGKLSIASGQPTAALVAGIMRGLLRLDVVVVPYRGDPQAMLDVIAGRVQLTVSAEPVVAPQLAAGKIRLIAAVGSDRNPFHPDVPTLAEQGVDAKLESWGGLFGPRGFPAEAVAKLNDALKRALEDPTVIQSMQKAGIGVRYSSPAELSRLASNRPAVAELIKQTGAKIFEDCR